MKDVIRRIRELNNSLPDLLLGILFFGIICEVVVIIVASDILMYSVALWLGVILAIGMAIHMAKVLYNAVSFGEGGAEKSMRNHSFLRYAVLVIILGIIMITEILNPLMVFLGIMGLKVAAYIQPITHRLVMKILGE